MTLQTALKMSVLASTGEPNEANEAKEISTQPPRGQIESDILPRQHVADRTFEASSQRLFDTSARKEVDSPTFPKTRLTNVNEANASRFELLAEWDGCVTSVARDGYYFVATLKGKVGEGVQGEEEEASIPMDDVSEGDRDLLRPGNFFRLCVIHEVQPGGQPRRYTQVVFRRMPAFRQHDIEQASELAREIALRLRVE